MGCFTVILKPLGSLSTILITRLLVTIIITETLTTNISVLATKVQEEKQELSSSLCQLLEFPAVAIETVWRSQHCRLSWVARAQLFDFLFSSSIPS